jgi:teichoic acid transport system ATP-binding protein
VTEAKVFTPPPPADPNAPATIVVDNLHVTYRVLVGGRRYRQKRRLLTRSIPTRAIREIYAVRGVSFTLRQGESVGLVGRNGSGKSTLLRAVSGLVPASAGCVWTMGEPTLLGVNAALMSELSGERNVVLGTLALGMSPQEVREKYDSIVDFAGLREFIDLPMSAYSSGMGARLRFAIATATTQPVLLIDEALATGDIDFRERSQARIQEMRDAAGSVILVSHSLGSIQETCNRAIWLDAGEIQMDGDVDTVLAAYREAMRQGDRPRPRPVPSDADPDAGAAAAGSADADGGAEGKG